MNLNNNVNVSMFDRLHVDIFAPQIMSESHWHGHIEMNYLFNGSMNYLFNGEFVQVPPKTQVIFWAGIPHQMTHFEEETPGVLQMEKSVFELCNIYLPLDQFLFWSHIKKLQNDLLNGAMIAIPSLPWHEQLLIDWCSEYQKENFLLSEERSSLMLQEIQSLLRRGSQTEYDYIIKPSFQKKKTERAVRNINSHAVTRMVAYILEHIERSLTVHEIASAAKLHPNYAMQLFMQTMKITIKQFIIRLRLLKARTLLLETNLPMTTIAMRAGFGSTTQFYEHFNRAYQTTPKNFRHDALDQSLLSS